VCPLTISCVTVEFLPNHVQNLQRQGQQLLPVFVSWGWSKSNHSSVLVLENLSSEPRTTPPISITDIYFFGSETPGSKTPKAVTRLPGLATYSYLLKSTAFMEVYTVRTLGTFGSRTAENQGLRKGHLPFHLEKRWGRTLNFTNQPGP